MWHCRWCCGLSCSLQSPDLYPPSGDRYPPPLPFPAPLLALFLCEGEPQNGAAVQNPGGEKRFSPTECENWKSSPPPLLHFLFLSITHECLHTPHPLPSNGSYFPPLNEPVYVGEEEVSVEGSCEGCKWSEDG
eukprot:Hpha_TRINITY_DN16811_c3_g2::TRINITY_DN16811_c3_g2_i7::g.151314::m.151314